MCGGNLIAGPGQYLHQTDYVITLLWARRERLAGVVGPATEFSHRSFFLPSCSEATYRSFRFGSCFLFIGLSSRFIHHGKSSEVLPDYIHPTYYFVQFYELSRRLFGGPSHSRDIVPPLHRPVPCTPCKPLVQCNHFFCL